MLPRLCLLQNGYLDKAYQVHTSVHICPRVYLPRYVRAFHRIRMQLITREPKTRKSKLISSDRIATHGHTPHTLYTTARPWHPLQTSGSGTARRMFRMGGDLLLPTDHDIIHPDPSLAWHHPTCPAGGMRRATFWGLRSYLLCSLLLFRLLDRWVCRLVVDRAEGYTTHTSHKPASKQAINPLQQFLYVCMVSLALFHKVLPKISFSFHLSLSFADHCGGPTILKMT